MQMKIGIRREDKNRWEARVPLTPDQVRKLVRHSLQFIIQPSAIRTFSEAEFEAAGAIVAEDLSDCDVILAVKEIPLSFFAPNKTYVFFSHTIKGQKYNMPMLKKMMAQKCQLIDYEKVSDDQDRRLLFFGRHAGLAGMIDTLWALGQRLNHESIANPFSDILPTYRYHDLNAAKAALAQVADKIRSHGLPKALAPLICGFLGYGNVSKGAQEIFDCLPVKTISPAQALTLANSGQFSSHELYKVVFKEQDLVQPVQPNAAFSLQDYYQQPQNYRSQFEHYLQHLTLVVNCVYWDNRYPRFVTRKSVKELFATQPRLRVIGDLSCDVEGAIECTLKATSPDNPVFVYDPATDQALDGVAGSGPVVLAVDNLPCELPKEASQDFGQVLSAFVPAMAAANYQGPLENCALPDPIKKALILYQGQLTPNYQYMQKYL